MVWSWCQVYEQNIVEATDNTSDLYLYGCFINEKVKLLQHFKTDKARSLQGWQLGEYRSRTSTIMAPQTLFQTKIYPA
jgi:hypothetical protein